MFNLAKLKHQDPVLGALGLILSIIGLANIFATTYFPARQASDDFWQQIGFVLVGLIFYLFIVCLPISSVNIVKVQAVLLLAFSLLLTVLLFLDQGIEGPRRWLLIGSIAIQPSELAKIVIITFTASIFADHKLLKLAIPFNIQLQTRSSLIKRLSTNPLLPKIFLSFVGTCLIVLPVLRQPSLGNAVLITVLWLVMISSLLAGIKSALAYGLIFLLCLNLSYPLISFNALLTAAGSSIFIPAETLLLLGLTGLVSIVIVRLAKLNILLAILFIVSGLIAGLTANFIWQEVFTDYQKERVTSFLNPENDPLGTQWQVSQAKIAIASGQIFGKGYLRGTQSSLGLLPFAYTDFAYAAFSEQFGAVGSFILLMLYILLLNRIFRVADLQESNFGKLVCIGVAAMIGLNTIVNVGMNLGLLPVTGVPLPLVSYGGSAVLVNFIGLGLVQMLYSSQAEHVPVSKLLTSE